MDRYFFDLDGVIDPDDDGLELPGAEAALAEALKAFPDMVRDREVISNQSLFSLTVRRSRQPLFRLTLELLSAPARHSDDRMDNPAHRNHTPQDNFGRSALLMNFNETLIREIANSHEVTEGAVSTALSALQRGKGTMAQFSHPDFGGMAQWSKGGMSMVGDMFNSALKAKLDGVMSDLAAGLDDGTGRGLKNRDERLARSSDMASGGRQESLWPSEFGTPSSSGGQNDMRYAFFPETRRLVVDDGSRRIVYDTGNHRISGVSQQQSGTRSLRFQSQDGDVGLDDLAVVE